MPPSSTAPLREPASNRTAEWPSLCQGDASPARASIAKDTAKHTVKDIVKPGDDANIVAAKPSEARMGTITVMRRHYSLARWQAIELLVMC